MKRLVCAILVSLVTAGFSNTANAQANPVESYCATLGPDDHFASDGFPLDNAAAIIRQDRANYHEFGIQDESDENDSTFDSKSNRAKLEAMLKRGGLTRADERAIVKGTPDICVDVYKNYIDVNVL